MSSRRGARQLLNVREYRPDSTMSLFVKNHKNPDQLLNQIEALYLQNQITESVHLMECVIENNSELLNSARFFFLYSQALVELQGFSSQAESALHQSFLMDRNDRKAQEFQSLFDLNNDLRDGLYSSAEEKLRTLLSHDPKNAMVLFLLGSHLFWKTENTAEAIAFLEKAVDLRPAFLKAWVHLAMAYKKSLLFVLADQAFQECLNLDPNPNQHNFYKTHLQAL